MMKYLFIALNIEVLKFLIRKLTRLFQQKAIVFSKRELFFIK